MAVYVNNLTINSGETFSQPLTILDSSGEILNLTGYAASSAVRKHPASTSKTTDFNVGITSAAEGLITLSLEAADTSNIKNGRYVYDVLLISNANIKSIVSEGMVLVRTGITS
jgi:hypothetical protein